MPQVITLKQKLKEVKMKLAFLKKQFLVSDYETTIKKKSIVFISVGWRNSRARVFVGTGNHFESSWKSSVNQAMKYIKKQSNSPDWIKADLVIDMKQLSIPDFINEITMTKKNYFRYGISFDDGFNLAFLEQEVNANAFIKYDQTYQRAYLDERNINNYVMKYRNLRFPVNFNEIKDVILFRTKGYFYDQEYFELNSTLLDNGRRKVHHLKPESTLDIIDRASQFLGSMIKEDGKFIYGYFSCFDRTINWYNILRHASTVYSMIEAYEMTRNKQLIEPIQKALDYLIKHAIYEFNPIDEESYAYVVDDHNGHEIKLGANAAAILSFTKYIEVFQDKQYLSLAQALARGIEKMQQKDTGAFVHVLNYPDLTVKETFRIVYYDGEASFALTRLYGIDKNPRWLTLVEHAFNYFIQNDYWKNHDHWLSYCTNELTMYRPEDRYFEFGLKNVFHRLDFIFKRETTYPTFLELTTSAYQMVRRMENLDRYALLRKFDINQLVKTIHHRAHYQLNGFFYPEVAMYFKAPNRLINGFFIRHHSFRIRIDDIEHNLSGYCHYLKDVLMEVKTEEVANS
ncbi:hypothetical protein GCM10011391_09490 [Pullulanibacillus camelliae]|uniref:Poly (Glycerol-phosphate) alpha-glucosyltransferase n=1 Tax=Pullulanibacillus camelliae TaxID=1707096 RepID=A0A8J2VJV8_9BACL|nr:hypothetical protein [Pullulanibacillus camelliae]GGE32936.1 hypothetical protein GCM10011391_09490 [Pullulanibacillus camelliae]